MMTNSKISKCFGTFSILFTVCNAKLADIFRPESKNLTSVFRFQDGFSFGGIENGYGCWCYFGDSHGQGKGIPKDTIDENCKVLHDGYECILLDTVNTCVPWEQTYISLSTIELFTLALQDTSVEAVMNDCEVTNAADECAIASCKVEQYFAYDYVKLTLTNAATIEPSFEHTTFNAAQECAVVMPTPSTFDKQCCGSYSSFTYNF